MTTSKTRKELAGLRSAALDDLMAATDEQLQREAKEESVDLDILAASVGAMMQETAAAVMRDRLTLARKSMQTRQTNDCEVVRPSVEIIKQKIKELFQADRSLGMAFREGKAQTDEDWESLYDDLVDMGVIKPEDQDD